KTWAPPVLSNRSKMSPPVKQRGLRESEPGSVSARGAPPVASVDQSWIDRSRAAAKTTEPSGQTEALNGEFSGFRYDVSGRGSPPPVSTSHRSLSRVAGSPGR